MARSILPSTAAKQARTTRASIHRAHRRAVNQRLAVLRRPGQDGLDFDLDDHDRYPQRLISDMVWERRAADKLNHFERWAVQSTKHLPAEDRLSHLRSVLPGGLIGAHAVSHLLWLPEIAPPGEHGVPDGA